MLFRCLSFFLLTSFICGTAPAKRTSSVFHSAKPGVTIHWDPDSPNKEVGAVWLMYLMARGSYRLEHKLPNPKSGRITPSFDEEVFARDTAAQVYVELRGKDKNLRDPYWNDVAAVKAKGFVREYVWTYFRQGTWPEKQKPANLQAFQTWQRQTLKKHRPQTLGGLAVVK